MSDISVRRLERDRDAAAVVELDLYSWASDRKVPADVVEGLVPWRSVLGAETEVDGRPTVVGIWACYDIGLGIPGPLGTVTMRQVEGATWCSVHPDHRRRGALTAMIDAHLARCRGLGSAITIHDASEPGIYGRFGYAIASYDVTLKLGKDQALVVPPAVDEAARTVATRTHLATDIDPVRYLAIEAACAAQRVGGMTHDRTHLEADLLDIPGFRDKDHPQEVIFATRDGADVGYARLSRTSKWENGLPTGEVRVHQSGALDLAAEVALVRRLTSYDLMTAISVSHRELDDPLLELVEGGPRAIGHPKVTDGAWLRIVDVAPALEARGYAAPVDVAFGLTDARAPWNAGTWRLVVGEDGVGRCAATADAPDLTLDVRHLSGAYLGTRTLAAMGRAGGIVEHTAGTLRLLSRAMQAGTHAAGGFGF